MSNNIETKKPQYKWWLDKKIISWIGIFSCLSLMIFGFFEIPFLTSINKYTIEMLFGWGFPFIYLYFIFLFSKNILKRDLININWIKINTFNYFFLVITIIFVSVSTGYYQSKNSWSQIGFSQFRSIQNWWQSFTYSKNSWIPDMTNGGFIGAFLYGFFSMIVSGIGSLIISIFLIIITLYLFFWETIIGFLRRKNNEKKIVSQKENKKEKTQIFEAKPVENIQKIKPEKGSEEDLPFEDPF